MTDDSWSQLAAGLSSATVEYAKRLADALRDVNLPEEKARIVVARMFGEQVAGRSDLGGLWGRTARS